MSYFSWFYNNDEKENSNETKLDDEKSIPKTIAEELKIFNKNNLKTVEKSVKVVNFNDELKYFDLDSLKPVKKEKEKKSKSVNLIWQEIEKISNNLRPVENILQKEEITKLKEKLKRQENEIFTLRNRVKLLEKLGNHHIKNEPYIRSLTPPPPLVLPIRREYHQQYPIHNEHKAEYTTNHIPPTPSTSPVNQFNPFNNYNG